MYKTKVNLVTFKDVTEFQAIINQLEGTIKLVDGNDYVINAKSLLGCMAALEWSEVYVVSDTDIYSQIKKFAM